MISNRIRKAIQISVFATAAALAGGLAQAAAYTGTWDPAYDPENSDPNIANLGWRGTAQFEVPGGCLAGTGLSTIDFGTGCAAGDVMAITSASVALYFVNDPNKNTVETLNFSGSHIVSSMDFDGNKLMGVHGGFFMPLKPINPSLGLGNTYFWLAFDGGPAMFHVTCVNNTEVGSTLNTVEGWALPKSTDSNKSVKDWIEEYYSPANITGRSCTTGSHWGWNDNPYNTGGAGLTWLKLEPTNNPPTDIPEPVSLALVMSALGAGWVARRRRAS